MEGPKKIPEEGFQVIKYDERLLEIHRNSVGEGRNLELSQDFYKFDILVISVSGPIFT